MCVCWCVLVCLCGAARVCEGVWVCKSVFRRDCLCACVLARVFSVRLRVLCMRLCVFLNSILLEILGARVIPPVS